MFIKFELVKFYTNNHPTLLMNALYDAVQLLLLSLKKVAIN